MTLQRYKTEDKRGMPMLVEADDGKYVKYDDAMAIIDRMAEDHSKMCKMLSSGWTIHKAPKADDDEGVTYFFEEPPHTPWLKVY